MEIDGESVAVLVEYKAGVLKPENGKLVPDNRKGLMRLSQLEWLTRDEEGNPAPEAEDCLVIMPQVNTCELKQIGNPKSRCYAFRMDGKDIKFFWLQEPDANLDSPVVADFNHLMSGEIDMDTAAGIVPGLPEASIAAPGIPASIPSIGAAVPVARQGPAGATGALGASELASILGNIMGGQADAAAMQQLMRGMAKAPGPSLGEIFTPEVIAPLLQDKEALERLQEHLPLEHRNFEGLMGVASSPQFHQQMETFSHALQTGQLDLAQFGLQTKGFTVADFLESIAESLEQENKPPQRDNEPKS